MAPRRTCSRRQARARNASRTHHPSDGVLSACGLSATSGREWHSMDGYAARPLFIESFGNQIDARPRLRGASKRKQGRDRQGARLMISQRRGLDDDHSENPRIRTVVTASDAASVPRPRNAKTIAVAGTSAATR
jgi:hypothetical protein